MASLPENEILSVKKLFKKSFLIRLLEFLIKKISSKKLLVVATSFNIISRNRKLALVCCCATAGWRAVLLDWLEETPLTGTEIICNLNA